MKVPLTLTFDTSDNETNAEVKGSLALTCRRNLKSLLEDIVEEKTLLPLFFFFFFFKFEYALTLLERAP